MKREVRQLIENFSDLFDDPEIFGSSDDSMFDNAQARKLFMNNLDRVLIEQIGTDCPNGWKKGKDTDGEYIYCNPKNGLYNMSAYIKKVADQLELKGWKKFEIGSLYALPYSLGMSIEKLYKKYNRGFSQYSFDRCNIQQEEFIKQLSDMPDFVNDLFKDGTGTYKCVMVSPDNGIIFTYQTYAESIEQFTSERKYISNIWQKAVIRLTGNVLYDELDSDTATSKKRFFKDEQKRKSFLSTRIKKSVGSSVNIKEIIITPTGLPMGITYFDWKEQAIKSRGFKAFVYPKQLRQLIIKKGFTALSKFEKEDPNSVFECEKDGLSFKFYKDVDCSNANSINTLFDTVYDVKTLKHVPKKTLNVNSCMICELTDYNLEQFEEIFDTYKKDDQ